MCTCTSVCRCTCAQGVHETGRGVPPCCPHPHPDTSDHTSPWEPGGPGGRCRVGGGGVKSEHERRRGGLCGVCGVFQCVCIYIRVTTCVCACTRCTRLCVCDILFLFEVCPPKREMRGSDLLFFWWARCEEALLHNY